MADDIFEEEEGAAPPSTPGTAGIDWALLAASRDKANAFLDKQGHYLDLQMGDLHEQRDLTLSHLQLRRISDYMRVGWQSLLGLVLFAAAVVIGVVLYQAANAHDLVIDPFSVPPDLAAQGIGAEQGRQRLLHPAAPDLGQRCLLRPARRDLSRSLRRRHQGRDSADRNLHRRAQPVSAQHPGR